MHRGGLKHTEGRSEANIFGKWQGVLAYQTDKYRVLPHKTGINLSCQPLESLARARKGQYLSYTPATVQGNALPSSHGYELYTYTRMPRGCISE